MREFLKQIKKEDFKAKRSFAIRNNRVLKVTIDRETRRGTAFHCTTSSGKKILVNKLKIFNSYDKAIIVLSNRRNHKAAKERILRKQAENHIDNIFSIFISELEKRNIDWRCLDESVIPRYFNLMMMDEEDAIEYAQLIADDADSYYIENLVACCT